MFRVAVFLVALLGLLSSAFSGYVVTSDDTGKYLAAAGGSNSKSYQVLVSTDYGQTWNSTSASDQQRWVGIASDGSGKRLALSAYANEAGQTTLPYTSTDEGATWVKSLTTGQSSSNYKIASGGNGDHLVVGMANDLYTSDNGGAYWYTTGAYKYAYGTGVAYSADSSVIVYSSNQYISKHKVGSAWGYEFYNSPAALWTSLSTSSNGSVAAGAYNTGYYANAHDDKGVYITTDWATFTPLAKASYPVAFYDVSVTDDGSLVYYGGSGGVYVYNVSTKTTVQSDLPATTDAPVYSIATSKTGKYAVVGAGLNIWTSSNYGKNFKIVK